MPNIKHAFTNPKADVGDATIVQPSNWNAEHVLDQYLDYPVQATTPAVPSVDFVRTFAARLGVAERMRMRTDDDALLWIAPMPVDRIIVQVPVLPVNLTSAPCGGALVTTTGTTVAAVVPANTNKGTRQPRATHATNATAGQLATMRTLSQFATRGNAAGLGGFLFRTIIGFTTLAAGQRAFFGLADSVAAPTNIDPTTDTTRIKVGLAVNTNTGNWRIIHNASATAPTVIDLGASFPVNATDILELVLYCPPGNAQNISYNVTNLTSGATASGTLSTNLPAVGTYLGMWFFDTNNATAGIVAFAHGGTYIEAYNA